MIPHEWGKIDTHTRVLGNTHIRVSGNTHTRVSGNTHTRVLGNTHTRVLTIPLAWGLPSIPLDKSLQLPQIIQKPTIYANIFVYSQEKAYICDRNRINMHL